MGKLKAVHHEGSRPVLRPLGQGISAPVPPHNLPAEISSFIGRDQQLVELEKLLGTYRLVTLTGLGGIGKTRIAARLGAVVAPDYSDGVWIVALATVTEPSLVSRAAAAVLEVGDEAGPSTLDALRATLRHRRLLLILDNCEHLVGACAEFVEEILASCPGVRVLATSQQPLRVSGEKVWRVPPMSFPESADALSADELASHDAVRLFCDRAAETSDGFILTPQMVPAVAEICRRLEGNPLALELAAARISMLSPAAIARRLDERFSLLTTGARNALPRHQGLQGALDWSHGLLAVPEQVLLARLSVFAGGCTAEAAAEVCAGEPVGESEVFDLLAGLVAKSFVIADTTSGTVRYRLIDTVLHYARLRLVEMGEVAEREGAHGWWCTRFYENAVRRLLQRPRLEPEDWFARIDDEHENFLVALDRALSQGAIELAVKLIGVLTPQWWARGRLEEGHAWAGRVIAESQYVAPALRAEALLHTAQLATSTGHLQVALRYVEELSLIAAAVGDQRLTSRTLSARGFLRLFLDGPGDALPLLEEAVRLARATEEKMPLAVAFSTCGRGYLFAGELDTAKAMFQEQFDLAEGDDEKLLVLHGLVGTGWANFARGDLPDAAVRLRRARDLAVDVGEPYATALSSCLLGEVILAQARSKEAAALLEESREIACSIRAPFPMAKSVLALGYLALEREDTTAAATWFDEAHSVSRSADQNYLEAYCLLGLGAALEAAGNASGARDRSEQALAFARAYGDKVATARALHEVGRLAGLDGDRGRAAACHHEALALQHHTGDRIGLASSLEALASAAAVQKKGEKAGRLLGAADSLREACSAPRPPSRGDSYDRAMTVLWELLGPEELGEALAEGRAMSADDAVAYALKGRGRRGRPTTGWASLTPAEEEVVNLVEQGLTNAEIGDRLFISRRTVGAHLSHVFTKLAVTSRVELAREARYRDA